MFSIRLGRTKSRGNTPCCLNEQYKWRKMIKILISYEEKHLCVNCKVRSEIVHIKKLGMQKYVIVSGFLLSGVDKLSKCIALGACRYIMSCLPAVLPMPYEGCKIWRAKPFKKPDYFFLQLVNASKRKIVKALHPRLLRVGSRSYQWFSHRRDQ